MAKLILKLNQIFVQQKKEFADRKYITFEDSEFTKKTEFELKNLDVFYFSFEGCKFEGEFLFKPENSMINFLNLQSAVFSKIARFVPRSFNNPKKIIGEIKVDYTAFTSSAIFEIEFAKCPDFSKCYFLEKIFIKETWPEINEKRIRPYERNKFLFLKSYFASIQNHLKENQYFGYEMRAREVTLESELYSKFKGRRLRHFVYLLCKMTNKKVRKLLVARCKIVSVKYCELFLFKCYKWFSGYGASIEKPLAVLGFSFLYFGYYFEIHNVKKPYESAFVRTLNPLYDSGKGYSTLLDLQTTIAVQSLINTILLFLIFLGIRNRFKIKS